MSRLRRTAEGILDDVRLALQSREPTGGMRVPYLGDWAGVVRTPSGARALEQLRRTLEGALDEPGTPVSMLTAGDLERMREDDRRFGPQIPLDLRGSLSDRRALLAHVDALQAQLDEARADRGGWVDQHLDLSARVFTLRAENERLKAERDAARAQVERLREALEAIDGCIAWSDTMQLWHLLGRERAQPALTLLRAALSETGGES